MGRLARLLGAMLVVLAVVPAVGHAAPRGDAAAFASAAASAAAEIRATAPQTRIDVAAAEISRCSTATQRLAALSVSPASRARFGIIAQTAVRRIAFARTLPPLQRFVAALDRVRTGDVALRSARAGWRRYVADLAVVVAVPVPADVCARLEAWVDAGAPGLFLPDLDIRAAAAVLAAGGGSREDARISRGAARLAALGAPRLRARRFGVVGMLSEHLRISQSITEAYWPPGSTT